MLVVDGLAMAAADGAHAEFAEGEGEGGDDGGDADGGGDGQRVRWEALQKNCVEHAAGGYVTCIERGVAEQLFCAGTIGGGSRMVVVHISSGFSANRTNPPNQQDEFYDVWRTFFSFRFLREIWHSLAVPRELLR